MKNILTIALTLFTCNAFAQSGNTPPDGGGAYEVPESVCVTEAQKVQIEKELKENRAMLVQQGILSDKGGHRKTTAPKLDWPIKQAAGFKYFKVYGVSNFVDLDANFPNILTDYNCGTRTYDNANGYNHAGTDIFIWPYAINMMDADQVEIIAAAAGTILSKHDGEFDKSCALNGSQWNAVYVEHADGSVAWYGHMKKGSLTTKTVGSTVAAGEYLGIVGSSGNSTGPHLHFELHDDKGKILDPYYGTCNNKGSLWNNQKPYRESEINALMTHDAVPKFAPCPSASVINDRDTFAPGSDIVFAGYYSDQVSGHVSKYSVLRPDNSIEHTWSHKSPKTYNASWWRWTRKVGSSGTTGKYTFRVNYQGKDYDHNFYIQYPTGVNGISAEDKLHIYPNPATNTIHIKGGEVNKVEVYNMVGQLVMTKTNVKDHIDVTSLQNGMYLLVIDNGDYIQRNKVQINR